MAQKFGNTWWGKEWLRSLTHIDWDNRIPRGAKYARLGYVKEIELTGRTINACVQGSRPAPYKVSITVPPFTAAETGRLVTALMKRPAVISRLLNRELSPEVMDIAQECGLRIFPRRWNDLQMTCNCPDWAVPCKHLAAVIYMFSHEIDNNPFIVFQMHGVDLLEELEKRGVEVDDMHKEIVVPELEKVVQLLKDKELPTELPAFRRIDFSRLSDCSEALLALLSDNPSFAPTGNFKDTYSAAIRHVKKTVQRFFNGKLAAANLFAPVLQPLQNIGVDDELTLHFDSSLCWKVNNIVRGKARPDLYLYDIHTLPVALLRINPDFLLDYHPTVSALYQSLFCALHLLSKGAVTPQLLRMSDQTYTIHWTPACIDPQIRALMDALEDIVPCTLVMTRPTGRKLDKCVARPGRWAVSFFLDMLIKDLSPRCDYQSLAAFFIKGWRHAFNNVGQQEVPGSIKAWTAAYQLAESDYRPVFSVEENPHYGFDLHIGVEDKRQPEPRITALCEILDSPAYEHERYRILHCFMLIRTLIKEMDYYIASGARLPIHYTTRSFIPFLLQVIPVMRMLDIKVFMPKALEKLIRPKATLSLKCKQEREKGFFCLADLFTFDWKVALGNDILSIDEFMKLQQEADGLLKFKQHYIYVDTQALQKLHEAFTKTERLTPAQLLQAALAEEFASAPVYLSDEVRNLIRELTTQQAMLQQAVVAGERVFELMDGPRQQYGNDDRPLQSGTIEVDNVSFAYRDDNLVLKNINLSVPSRNFVALVGHTGSGKSTLASLLMGYYPLTEGEIRLDGRPLSSLSHSALRQGVAMVQQDPVVLADTFLANVTLGRDISEERVWQALETVQLAELARSMSDGIYTPLGEQGNNLSVGQKQLLALARVLVETPQILILDEATASIDSGTEQAIQHALAAVREHTTLVVIAHRLSTIVDADTILVLHRGQAVEQGTHQQLLAAQGRYWQMYQLQLAGEELAASVREEESLSA